MFAIELTNFLICASEVGRTRATDWPQNWCEVCILNFLQCFYSFFAACRAVGATIVNRTEEIKEEDVGTECGLFEIEKIGDE
jgi:hypothetical protein